MSAYLERYERNLSISGPGDLQLVLLRQLMINTQDSDHVLETCCPEESSQLLEQLLLCPCIHSGRFLSRNIWTIIILKSKFKRVFQVVFLPLQFVKFRHLQIGMLTFSFFWKTIVFSFSYLFFVSFSDRFKNYRFLKSF